MRYQVDFRDKKTNELIKSIIIKKNNDIGIILKAKILLSPDFKYDKNKHSASFTEI